MLLSRFGAWSDAALWTEAVLGLWRREGFQAQKRDGMERHEYDSELAGELCQQQVDEAERRALGRDIHWATIFDLHTRINKFLVRVMLQRKEDMLPQLYQRPHQHNPAPANANDRLGVPTTDDQPTLSTPPGTVRPTYLTAPDAAMVLLLCVPPFHSLPRWVRRTITTDDECVLEDSNILNASPHHVDFAGIVQWGVASDVYSIWSLYMGPCTCTRMSTQRVEGTLWI